MKKTALHELHINAGARMVPFAGYELPVQYRGIKVEHLHTREKAGLFDVSHMAQVIVRGASAASQLEKLIPLDLESLPIGQQCYTFFPLANGGILDDLIIARIEEDAFYLVMNASRKEQDCAHLDTHLKQLEIEVLEDYALLALQGPEAATALTRVFSELADIVNSLKFMNSAHVTLQLEGQSTPVRLCRSGYTGEDGFELSIANGTAESLAKALVADPAIEWVGLGARDSLRLEAGLCLYGHDLDESISPVEAGLSWSIHKARRADGSKAGEFLGADIIIAQLEGGADRCRTGYVVDGKVPVREGVELVDSDGDERGTVTSGGFSPSLSRPIFMAYVDSVAREKKVPLFALVRGKKIPVVQTPMPFVASGK